MIRLLHSHLTDFVAHNSFSQTSISVLLDNQKLAILARLWNIAFKNILISIDIAGGTAGCMGLGPPTFNTIGIGSFVKSDCTMKKYCGILAVFCQYYLQCIWQDS